MDNLQLFMHLYMYELEICFAAHKHDLLNISFQSDEANTDRPLKEYIKHIIETECKCISEFTRVNNIEIYNPDGSCTILDIPNAVKTTYVQRVLLPEEITPQIKTILQERKNAVFTKPDICLMVNIDGKTKYEPVELKSTKSDSIPGSSVQQVSPEEWVIFIKHSQNNIEVTTGQYFNTINSKVQFPDRSPRPQVSFSELKNWNNCNRQDKGDVITYKLSEDESEKYDLLTDWQGVLAKRWVDILFNEHPRKIIPWFDNNLRIFILEFLKKYDKLTDTQKDEYKAFVESLIE